MNNEHLKRLIAYLNEQNSKEAASFGIYYMGEDEDEGYIQATKEGLELYAAKLLDASLHLRETEAPPPELEQIPEFNEEWMTGDTQIYSIQLLRDKNEQHDEEQFQETWKDKALSIGCMTIFLFAVLAMIIGFITIGQWIVSSAV